MVWAQRTWSCGESLYNWLFKRGPFFSNIGTHLGGKNVDEWFAEYTSYIIQWLDQVL
jgi:hypothetical protein